MIKELKLSKEIIIDDNTRLIMSDESYKDVYYDIKNSLEGNAVLLSFDEYKQILWDECNTFVMYMIEVSGKPVGIVCLKDYNDSIEIGCDVHADFQNKGIGQKSVKAAIDYLQKTYPEYDIFFKAYNDNLRSIHVIKKLGGVFVENEPSDIEKTKPVILEFLTTNGIDIPEGFEEPDDQYIEVYKYE